MPLIYLSCAWVAGILLGAKISPPLAIMLIGLAPLPLLFWYPHQRRRIILTSLCIVAFFGGAIHFQTSLPTLDEHSVQFYNDRETVEIKGVVDSDPEVGDKTTQLHLSAIEIKSDSGWHDVSGKALLFVPRYYDYRYGDLLLVSGELETPPQLDDFDYKGYLAHQGIYATMLYPSIEILERGTGFKPLEWVYSIRNRMSQALSRVLAEPQASLAQAILLGKRGMIPDPLKTDFTRSGTAHLLAISGLHLTVLAGMLLGIGTWLFGRRHYIHIWLTLGIVWLYALLTGMHPPVIRAAIMVSLFLAAELLGRQRSAFTSLAFAAAVMIGLNPQILWQASFQMSFMAMAGLVFIFPPLQAVGRRAVTAALGEDRKMVSLANTAIDSLSVSLGAVLAVWPLIAYYFGIVSFAAPVATLFALPALPGIVITAALAGGIGLIFPPVSQVIAWFAWLFLSYLMVVISVSAAFPLSFVEVGSINLAVIVVYYLALASALWLNSLRRRANISEALSRLRSEVAKTISPARLPMKFVVPPLLLLAVLALVAAATMPDDKLRVSFLDVGEGDAILIQRGSQQVLIDGGPSPQAIGVGLGKKMPFWDRTVELVISTHPHADHLTGLIEVLERYRVEHVLHPDLDYDSALYDDWHRLLEGKDIPATKACAGQQIDLGNQVIIKVLNPQQPPLVGTESDADNNGVVLRLCSGEVSFLLTADIFWEAEFELASQRMDLRSTVLKVAHHGSETSTSPEFLATVNPKIAVISVGEDNPHSHPSPEVMERLEARLGVENIYRTDEHGTVEFIIDGKRLWVKTER